MNQDLRTELERLKARQAQLHLGVDALRDRIEELERRVAVQEQVAQPEVDVPMAIPPVLAVEENVASDLSEAQPPEAAIALPGNQYDAATATAIMAESPAPPLLHAEDSVRQPAADGVRESDSFEMRLGTYWLVRIGIVAMLTALVFFGAYAYQNFIPKLGPAGKVSLLYLASGTLLGFGVWFQRRAAKESLRNYAQVLFAGGMAAVYFTTYAAHHFPNLRVIGSAVLDGALLLGWAAFMAWIADRKKSEVFAMFAIGLAYYTSVITRVGHFTLYSNLVLAAAVLFFLVRNRWAKLSFASLIATYASYGFWRFYSNEGWQWAGAGAELWAGAYFLVAYWLIFTTAVFLSRHAEFTGVKRATFITLNNAAFYAMFLLTMLQVRSGGFWKFNVLTGAVLLAAAILARIRLRDEPLAANTYLSHGLLLVTIGIIAKFNHDQSALALALCAESVLLWITGTFRRSIIMRTGACVSAALATLWTLDGIQLNDGAGVWLAAGVGSLFLLNALWSVWKGQGSSPYVLRPAPSYFSSLALVVWSVAIWQNASVTSRPAVFALLASLALAAMRATRLREMGLLAQLLLPIAGFLFVFNIQAPELADPWWVFAAVTGAALVSVHWWQRQTTADVPRHARLFIQVMLAMLVAGVIGLWLHARCTTQAWLLTASLLVLTFSAYGAVTRNGILAIVGQGFGVLSMFCFLLYAGTSELAWWAALAPVASLTILSIGGRRWAVLRESEYVTFANRMTAVSVLYRRVAMVLVGWWILQYSDVQNLVWSFTGVGVFAFALAGWRGRRDSLVFALALNICAMGALIYQLLSGLQIFWLNLASILIWIVQQQVARRQPGRFDLPAMVHNAAMLGSGVALWSLTSRWMAVGFSGFYLTASWSLCAFAIFAAGVTLRERVYRWLGLGILGAALMRVVVFDVWKLDTLYRILSFFALGLVLLVLGFIYNKYHERIRQWL